MTIVALLRGINVGKAKRVAMGDLRALVTRLGFSNARTLLNSGNVVFDAPARTAPAKAAGRLEAALAEELGVSSRVVALTGDELAAIVDGNPLPRPPAEWNRLLVTILADAAHAKRLAHLRERDWSPDAFAVSGRAVYGWYAAGLLESRLAAAIAKAHGEDGTARNFATMTKLKALATS